MNNLILVRHGQSLWNKEKRFTGWADIDLTDQGKLEAELAGKLIKDLNIEFQAYFTSICSKSFLEGVAAHMLAGEAAIPGLYIKIARKLQEQFGLSDEAVAYWVIHDSADEEHSDVGVKLLDQYAKTEEDRRLVLKIVRQMLEIQQLMYDDIYKHAQLI